MSDLMRSQFEDWHRSVVDGEPPHEKYSDGSYINPHVNLYWTGWQASRECLVIELPYVHSCAPSEASSDQDYYLDEAKSDMRHQCRAAIHAAGVKYK